MMLDHRRLPAPRRFTPRADDGFTLIELLVVITILGVLAAVVVFAVRGAGNESKDNAVAADARVLRTAEEAYCSKFGEYGTPADLRRERFLAATVSPKPLNKVRLGGDERCGTGAKSSFVIYANAPPAFVPGKERVSLGGGANATGIAINAKTNRIYLANEGTNSVAVMDGETDEIIGSPIAVPFAPRYITVNPAANKVYVACFCGSSPNVAVIDLDDGNRVTPLRFPATGAPAFPTTIGFNPAAGEVYVGGFSTEITYIDAANAADDIDIGREMSSDSAQFVFNPTTNRIFFQTFDSAPRLAVVNGDTHALVTLAPFPARPPETLQRTIRPFLTVDAANNRVYVTAQDTKQVPNPVCPDCTSLAASGALIVFDGNNGYAGTSLLDGPVTYPVGFNVLFNSSTGMGAYYGSIGSTAKGAIVRFDHTGTTGQANVKKVPFGADRNNPTLHMALNPTTNRVYLTQKILAFEGANGGLAAVDLDTVEEATFIGEGRVFASVAVNPETNKIYAIDRADNSVAVLK